MVGVNEGERGAVAVGGSGSPEVDAFSGLLALLEFAWVQSLVLAQRPFGAVAQVLLDHGCVRGQVADLANVSDRDGVLAPWMDLALNQHFIMNSAYLFGHV